MSVILHTQRLVLDELETERDAAFILAKLKEYGLKDSQIIDLPTRGPLTWDAEMEKDAEVLQAGEHIEYLVLMNQSLWQVKPEV